MIISLLGYMGSGKSTTGKKIANALNYQWIDLDQFIENEQNKTVSQMFEELGELQFRELERKALLEVLENKDNVVLSLGGGTPCYSDNMERVNLASYSVYIELPVRTLCQRLSAGKSTRPLIADKTEDELQIFITNHLATRKEYYEKAHLFFSPLKDDLQALIQDLELSI